jgi:hypothetical protein
MQCLTSLLLPREPNGMGEGSDAQSKVAELPYANRKITELLDNGEIM